MTANAPTKRVRELVYNRDHETCAATGYSACFGGITLQHRVGRGAGGSRLPFINAAPNLIVMCFAHNGLIEQDAKFKAYATENGWSIPRNRKPALVPAEIPVFTPDGWCVLNVDGTREQISPLLASETMTAFGLHTYGEDN